MGSYPVQPPRTVGRFDARTPAATADIPSRRRQRHSPAHMTCTHCGYAGLSMQYTLRFTPERGRGRTMKLQLCTACLDEFRTAPDVEFVPDENLDAVNPGSH